MLGLLNERSKAVRQCLCQCCRYEVSVLYWIRWGRPVVWAWNCGISNDGVLTTSWTRLTAIWVWDRADFIRWAQGTCSSRR